MIEPINYTAALRRSWRLLLVLAVVFAIVAVLLPVSKAPSQKKSPLRYRANAIVGAPPSKGIVGSATVSEGQILFYGNNFFLKGAAVAAAKTPGPTLELIGEMSASPQTTKPASGSGTSTASTAPIVKGSAKDDTGLVELAASAATKEEAVALVNQYATTLGNKLTAVAVAAQAESSSSNTGKSSSSDTSSKAPVTGYQVMIPAQLSTTKRTTSAKSSITSSRKVRLVVGLLIGLIIGALVVLIVELMNKKLRLASRAEAHFKYPVVAEIPQTWPPPADAESPSLVMVTQPLSRAAEAYRKLRMSVLFEALAPMGPAGNQVQDPYADSLVPTAVEPYIAPAPESRAVILVVSPAAEASRPRVVVNLGAAYAEAGQRVVIVSTSDIDSGAPSGAAGYTGPIGPDDVRPHLRPSSIENVSMLSLRPFVKNSAQLVGRATPVFEATRQLADVVLVEAPPFLQYHHGEALAHAVDVVLVVGECGSTTFDGADETGVLLRRIGAPVLGVVFTETPLSKAEKLEFQGSAATPPESPAVTPEAEVPPEATSQYPVDTQA
jgi:Mrp family chromosome partitioning ATPase/capsular polysaccharide biosynthesis protein